MRQSSLKKIFLFNKNAIAALLFSLVLIDALIPLVRWHLSSQDIPVNVDSSEYVYSGLVAHSHFKSGGVLHFINNDFFKGRNWRGTAVPFLLLPGLLLTDGNARESILITNLLLLLVLSGSIFLFSSKFTNTLNAAAITSAVLFSTWVYGVALVFSSDLPMLASFVLSIYLYFKNDRPGRSFFVAIAIATLIRPAEAMAMFGPFVLFESWIGIKNRKISSPQLLSLSLLFMLEMAAICFLYLKGKPTDSTVILCWSVSAIALTILIRYFWKNIFVSGSLLFITITWLWYFPEAQKVAWWVYSCAIGRYALEGNEDKNWALGSQISRLMGYWGLIPVLVSAAYALFWALKNSKIRSPAVLLAVALLSFPIAGLLSANQDVRYYVTNFVFAYGLMMFVIFTTLDKKIRNRFIYAVSVGAILIFFNFVSNDYRYNKWIGRSTMVREPIDSNYSDLFLDQLQKIPNLTTGTHFCLLKSEDTAWQEIGASDLAIRSIERNLPGRYSYLSEDMSLEKPILPQLDWLKSDFVVTGPMSYPDKIKTEPLALLHLYNHLKSICAPGSKQQCPFENARPFTIFTVIVHGIPKTFEVYKVRKAEGT